MYPHILQYYKIWITSISTLHYWFISGVDIGTLACFHRNIKLDHSVISLHVFGAFGALPHQHDSHAIWYISAYLI